jgi:multidrug efflux pump subunit AcrA (membrane-fusion protein)
LFAPWVLEGESAGVVEIVQRPGASPSLQAGYLRFLEAACELVAEYERNALLRAMRQRERHWARIDEFSRTIHASLDVLPTAYAIANEGLRILQCDRVSVLVRRGPAYKAVAMSGAESFSRRSNSVRWMERLAAAAMGAGEALWHPADRELPPQIAEPLDAYLDESHARGLGILPLRAGEESEGSPNARIIGGLVVERFFGPADEPLRNTAAALAAHGALALQNALTLERLPLGRVLRTLGAIAGALGGRRLAACALGLALVCAVVAALALAPADFSVEARGELQPVAMRDIFAPDDAVAVEVRAQSGTRVEANQVVLTLRRPALEFELKRIWGESQTATKKLAAVESEQLLNRREDETQRKRYTELTAQQEELRALLGSLQSQLAILRQQQSELEVRSPIAGEVLTWDAEQLLAARPVSRGQALLTVADLAGPWRLELRVPERRVAHLAEAMRDSDSPLEVSFALATNPAQVLRGRLDQVGGRAEITETDGAVVLAAASIDGEEIPERVPGASVVARIHCGRRALGYVWLHDLIDAVRTWFLF